MKADQPDELTLNLPFDIHGIIRLTLFIGEQGGVDDVLFETDPTRADDEALKDIVLPMIKNLKFVPGMKDGHPVRSRIRIELDLDRERSPLQSWKTAASMRG